MNKHRPRWFAGKQVTLLRIGLWNRGQQRTAALIVANTGSHIVTSNGNRIKTDGV